MASSKTSKKAPPSGGEMSPPKPGMPLFFSNPKVISSDRHENAKLRPGITMNFARNTNSLPLTVADIAEAAKSYPVAFIHGNIPLPVAIVGLEGENYFVDEEGKWLERSYVPSYARKYPFVFMEVPDSTQLTLCVDEDTLAFDADAEGTPLYENGAPSPFIQDVLSFCTKFQEQHQVTKLFAEKLQSLDILIPQKSTVELASKRVLRMDGFQLIDVEKFSKLPEPTIIELHNSDFLSLIHFTLQSQSNWQQLLRLANQHER